jgi:hypothetical protein
MNGARTQVFLSVGVVRGMQISLNYAKRYGTTEEVKTVESEINYIMGGQIKKKTIDNKFTILRNKKIKTGETNE